MMLKERRSYVREAFPFRVKFRLLTPEEHQAIREAERESPQPEKETTTSITEADRGDLEITLNAALTDFLLQMDEKLDHILSLLSKAEVGEDVLPKQGTGTNISGSGMNMLVEEPLEVGRIIHAHFVLSRIPLVCVDTFGEVNWVEPVDEYGTTRYSLGIEFVGLKPIDRERIIACVFQRQRKTIRERKAEGG
jgi:hypothetical protein